MLDPAGSAMLDPTGSTMLDPEQQTEKTNDCNIQANDSIVHARLTQAMLASAHAANVVMSLDLL